MEMASRVKRKAATVYKMAILLMAKWQMAAIAAD
jgi:hypothetical protein